MKYSKQRESILNYLRMNNTHPTAEAIYHGIQAENPNISLGTVYRNLTLLTELGEIQKLAFGDGPDRFDGNLQPHYHFACTKCGKILDLKMDGLEHIDLLAAHKFKGQIEGHFAYFYGKCPSCIESE